MHAGEHAGEGKGGRRLTVDAAVGAVGASPLLLRLVHLDVRDVQRCPCPGPSPARARMRVQRQHQLIPPQAG